MRKAAGGKYRVRHKNSLLRGLCGLLTQQCPSSRSPKQNAIQAGFGNCPLSPPPLLRFGDQPGATWSPHLFSTKSTKRNSGLNPYSHRDMGDSRQPHGDHERRGACRWRGHGARLAFCLAAGGCGGGLRDEARAACWRPKPGRSRDRKGKDVCGRWG